MICVCFYNLYLSVLINSRSIAYICKHNSAPCIVPYTSLRIRLEDHQRPSSSWPRSSWSHLPGPRLLGFSTPLLPSFNVTGSSCYLCVRSMPFLSVKSQPRTIAYVSAGKQGSFPGKIKGPEAHTA